MKAPRDPGRPPPARPEPRAPGATRADPSARDLLPVPPSGSGQVPGMRGNGSAGRAINRRILIIDDSAESHHAYAAVLTPRAASGELAALADVLFDEPVPTAPADRLIFEMDRATQGHEGLEKVRQALAEGRPYALAFVDMRMPPGWDGVRTTREIWAVDPRIEIVISTAYMDHDDADILALGAETDQLLFLRKPFASLEVAQMARSLTHKWSLRAGSEQAERNLAHQVELTHQHERIIEQLSVPVLQVLDGVVAVPLIGELDAERGARLLESLLSELKRRRAHTLVLDLTGLRDGQGVAAQGLRTVVRAAALLGVRCLLCGLRPALAISSAGLGESLGDIRTTHTLAEAIRLVSR